MAKRKASTSTPQSPAQNGKRKVARQEASPTYVTSSEDEYTTPNTSRKVHAKDISTHPKRPAASQGKRIHWYYSVIWCMFDLRTANDIHSQQGAWKLKMRILEASSRHHLKVHTFHLYNVSRSDTLLRVVQSSVAIPRAVAIPGTASSKGQGHKPKCTTRAG
ncbi:hypothetical protein RSOL_315160, partial [Rhizoctonia solani AG-3 Rhs1AP]